MAFEHPPLPPDDAPFDDPDNPEWTEEDLARAKPVHELPEAHREAIYAAFPNTRRPGDVGGQRVVLKLDREVAEHFKVGEPGWQARINAALQQLIQAARAAA